MPPLLAVTWGDSMTSGKAAPRAILMRSERLLVTEKAQQPPQYLQHTQSEGGAGEGNAASQQPQ
jgi:hypothetical protein